MSDEVVIENELVTIQKAQAMDVFTKRELITPLLEKIEQHVMQETFDASTDKGRKAIASLAYKVAQSKTYIESHGKELAAELKELPKLVDSNRKFAKDFLDELKDRVRKPLTDWEAEQAAIKLQKEIEEAHAEARLDNIEWELNRKAEQKRLETERAEYEARVLESAEARAKVAAENKARQDIIDAEARALSAEREIARAEERAKKEIEEATQRAKDEAQKEQELKDQRAKQEQERITKEKGAKAHMGSVHSSIINDLLAIGLNSAQAQFIFNAVLENKIKALRIVY